MPKAAARRRAEDAVAGADKAVAEAQAALDKAALDRRAGRGSDAALEAARTALSRAQDRLKQQKAELHRIEADASTPLPNFADGQVNVARAESAAAIAKLTIRAPIAGTVLQVNAKPGELVGPSNAQPLLIIGDVSALRVRAELDERDLGEIKIGQPVLVRADAFRGREFAGKVSFIAPLVEQGRITAYKSGRIDGAIRPGSVGRECGHSTAPFTSECQSFLDNAIARFGQTGAWNNPRGVGSCAIHANYWKLREREEQCLRRQRSQVRILSVAALLKHEDDLHLNLQNRSQRNTASGSDTARSP